MDANYPKLISTPDRNGKLIFAGDSVTCVSMPGWKHAQSLVIGRSFTIDVIFDLPDPEVRLVEIPDETYLANRFVKVWPPKAANDPAIQAVVEKAGPREQKVTLQIPVPGHPNVIQTVEATIIFDCTDDCRDRIDPGKPADPVAEFKAALADAGVDGVEVQSLEDAMAEVEPDPITVDTFGRPVPRWQSPKNDQWRWWDGAQVLYDDVYTNQPPATQVLRVSEDYLAFWAKIRGWQYIPVEPTEKAIAEQAAITPPNETLLASDHDPRLSAIQAALNESPYVLKLFGGGTWGLYPWNDNTPVVESGGERDPVTAIRRLTAT